jgi:mono/diheme cytochrome c family protein
MTQRPCPAVETAPPNITKSASADYPIPVRGGGLRAFLRGELIRPAAALAAAALVLASASAQTKKAAPVSFKKQIAPILAANCTGCHGGAMPQSGFDSSSFAKLMAGGKHGKAVIPANGRQSPLVQYLDGRKMPRMPIGGTLKPAEIAVITRWIDEGAKSDGEAAPANAVKPIKPLVDVLPQAASLAWSKDGKWIVVGTYKKAEVFEASTGRRAASLSGYADVVRALAFSPNGDQLAAAGGVPGQGGEIKLWSVADWKPVRSMQGHADSIYGVAWRTDGKQLVSASYDKTLKLWDPSNGAALADLKDHADAVYACAYHANGKFLATGSADRSVRVWDPAKGTRIYTLAGHTEMVTALAFHPTAEQLVTAGADKAPRLWNLKADSGENTRTYSAQTDVLTDAEFAPDGATFATASNDGKVCIFDPGKNDPVKTIQASSDAVLAIAYSPDSKRLAIGCYDGSVRILEVADGKVAVELIKSPDRTKAAKAVR